MWGRSSKYGAAVGVCSGLVVGVCAGFSGRCRGRFMGIVLDYPTPAEVEAQALHKSMGLF